MDELLIYSRWDGTQDVDLEYRAMLDDFLDKYMETGDVGFALEWMMREGVHLGKSMIDLAGLDRMARQLWQQRARMLRDYNPSGLTDRLRRELDSIVSQELDKVRNEQERAVKSGSFSSQGPLGGKMRDLMWREELLTGLPHRLGDAVDALKRYPFLDPEAAERFRNFVSEMEQLARFLQNNMFGGDQPLSLEDARALMEEVRALEDLIRAMERGDLGALDLDALARYLGEQSRRAIQRFLEFSEFLRQTGMVMEDGSRLEITPLGMKRIGERALSDIYSLLGKTPLGSHPSAAAGQVTPLPDESRPLRFGDPFRLHLNRTMMNAVLRECGEGGKGRVRLKPQDFEILEGENTVRSATALLVDMSLSMFQGGRFAAAKKVALALEQLVRTRYPRDDFYLIGFATVARRLSRRELVECAGGLGDDIFTNIQDALRQACRLLGRHREARPQIILVTDGQPTAFFHEGRLHVEWPLFGVAAQSNLHTLKEVREVTRQGITINTFMLDRQRPLIRFVEEMTRINKGRAFFTAPDQLGRYLLLDFLGKRKRVIH